VIARMEKLYIAGPRSLVPKVLAELQRLGVVQVDELPTDQIGRYRLGEEDEARLRKWESVAMSADHAAGLLGLELEAAVEPFPDDLSEAGDSAAYIEKRAADLVEKRERLRDELQLIDQYKEVVTLLAEAIQDLDRSTRLAVMPFLVEKTEGLKSSKGELAEALDDRFVLAEWEVRGIIAAVVISLKRDADQARGILAHGGLRELPRTAEYPGLDLKTMAERLAERSQQAPDELAGVEQDLRHLRQETAEGLLSLWIRARDEANRLKTFKALGSGRFGFALFGWLPVCRKPQVVELLQELGDQVLYTTEAAPEHDQPEQVPVMLENPRWIRPFEILITFMTTPRYDSRDPTWTVAIYFPLWFGMIVGDVGYGLAFAAVAWYLYGFARRHEVFRIDFFRIRLAPAGLRQLLRIMTPMIAWTLVWGLVYGECFGNLCHRLGLFATDKTPGLIPTLIHRTDTAANATMLILVSIGFGTLQVLHGFILKAYLGQRQGDRERFWEGCGYFGGVAALVLCSYAFMESSYPWWLLIPALAGFALFAAGVALARRPLMVAELPTQGGHILSYIRIYAIGLAGAVLADLATDIGFGLSQTGGFLGITGLLVGGLIGLLLGSLIHVVLTIFLIASHVLQPIRLLWVEFFIKFDFYSFRGRPYRPFKLHNGRD
jgi:V/A-type H+/Na+-transporting ATPase subunit I